MRLWLSLLVLAMHVHLGTAAPYFLDLDYTGERFYPQNTFFTGNDPTNGYVDYIDYDEATSLNLTYVNSKNQLYIGTDMLNVANGRGRKSIRTTSRDIFNGGLFVMDLEHMPTGCGTWPAFWSFGPDWPTRGEIDIMEGVNREIHNAATLHTDRGCDQARTPDSTFAGRWADAPKGRSDNCWVNAPGQYFNAGCGQVNRERSFGEALNDMQGGVMAMEWDPESHIKTWFFPRGQIPRDLEGDFPDPDTWGLPFSNFLINTNDCPSSHFRDHSLIINLTFCGDWAGNVFDTQCPGLGRCVDFVRNNPSAFTEAYWLINYVKVFQKAAGGVAESF